VNTVTEIAHPGKTDTRDDPSSRGKRIGVLIVAYNAVTTISRVLDRIPAPVWNNVEEVVIFDDASPDATYELAVGLKTLTQNPKLHILKHHKNLGYGGNQKAGYRYFIDKGFDVVVLLHGDGQYAPEILARMYHPLVTGEADAVFGSRMMRDYGGPLKGGMPFYKFVGNKVLTHFENRALGMALTEFHSGYRAYDLHALKRIDFSHMTNDFHFDTEIIIKLHHQGFRIHEVPCPTFYGDEICRVNGLKYAKDIVRAVRRYNRARRSIERCPEFQEYYVQYPVKSTPRSSHDLARRAVGTGQRVLDIGCGDGNFSALLQKAGNSVTGIDRRDWTPALESLDDYRQVDLDQASPVLPCDLQEKVFDHVLLLDVLQTLRHPEALLGECAPLLGSTGKIVVSVPNIANITVRMALLFGSFRYRERGILDRSHLRFFTARTAREMLQAAGYRVVTQKMTAMPVGLALGFDPGKLPGRLLHGMAVLLAGVLPRVFGYQVFLTAQRAERNQLSAK
jgi:glycosyltransferase involved in cell wall biosynthesis/ubiquinone/menaquinone biosynthesis C-methylase UbiE